MNEQAPRELADLAYDCAVAGGGLEAFMRGLRTRNLATVQAAVDLAEEEFLRTSDDRWTSAARLMSYAISSGFFGHR